MMRTCSLQYARRSLLLTRGRAAVVSERRPSLCASTRVYSTSDPHDRNRAAGMPEFIERYAGTKPFKIACGLFSCASAGLLLAGDLQLGILASLGTAAFAWRGFNDMRQTSHTILRNFPVLGHMRYIFESIRPEVRQYFVEGDQEAKPFSREQRALVYQRAKGDTDAQAFGTRRDVYAEGYEYALHSIFPATPLKNPRVIFGESRAQPYSCSLLNVSAMSFGAISSAAITAFNAGAKLGGFYSNTGEGGLSKYHLQGGDLVWNIGSGYFGCRNPDGTFSASRFVENATRPTVKMIELKLSQGAKPGKGGVLPAAKVSPDIAAARGLTPGEPSYSPSRHSAFKDPESMVRFVEHLRQLSGGKPVGIKLCVGDPVELAQIIQACVKTQIFLDFITVDGAEGGTGAAPPEFSNRMGTPLFEGLWWTHNLLVGAGIRDKTRIIASGKIVSGFDILQAISLGADTCNSARGFMFAIGCIQSLKCHANTCPTGIATQDPKLIAGLDVAEKRVRAFNFQAKTVEAACEMIASCGFGTLEEVRSRPAILVRTSPNAVASLRELYPPLRDGELLKVNYQRGQIGGVKERLFRAWNIATSGQAHEATLCEHGDEELLRVGRNNAREPATRNY